MSKNKQILIFTTALLLCFASLGLTLFLGYQYNQNRTRREVIAFEHAKQEASLVALSINRELTELMTIARGIANDLTTGDLSNELLTDRLRNELEKKPAIFGLGAAYEPEAYKPGLRLYAPYYVMDEFGDFSRIQVENYYDYTDPSLPQTTWYHETLDKGDGWVEPYFGQAAQAFLAEYLITFYRFDPDTLEKKPAGVIYADHSLETLTTFIKSLDLGEEGYSYILSKEGQFVAHPDKEFLGKTIFDRAGELEDEVLRGDGERATRGEIFYREGVDIVTGQNSWIFYEPIPVAGWSIGIVLDKNANAPPPETVIRDLTWIGLTFISFLIFLSALVFRLDKGTIHSFWMVAISVAVILAGGIGFIWYLVITNPAQETEEVVLVNETRLNDSLAPVNEALTQRGQALIRIPTGIIVENVKFSGVNEATVAGYIWQKYPLDLPEEIEREFILPDTLDPEGVAIEEIYRVQEGGIETIGWFFRAALRQVFHKVEYPLDQATVQIQIWPKSLDQNVVLTPDLDAYEFMTPSQRPGLANNLRVEGWDLSRSFFSYRFSHYNANFGSKHTIQKNNLPTLFFNVSARRLILSPIIAYGVTAFVVAVLMFAVMAIHAESAFNILTYAAALFFVIAVTHVGLRGELVAEDVVYLEYYFILLYGLVLIGSVNSMLYYSKIHIPFIQYKENLIPKLLYWPVVLGILLAITLTTFYPSPSTTEAKPAIAHEQAGLLSEETPTVDITPTSEISETPEVVTQDQPTALLSPTTQPTETQEASDVGPETTEPVTLHYLIEEELATLDPSLARNIVSIAQIKNLFIGLTRLDIYTGEALPFLATDWSVSTDGLEWTFHLRDDVAWVQHDPQTGETTQVTDFDGNPRFVNAHDVVYGLKRALNPDTPTPLVSMLYVIKNAREINTGQDTQDNPTQLTLADIGVEAIDDWTVKLTLEYPAAYLPAILANQVAYPLPEWTINEWADEWAEAGRINTNGPYVLANWERGQHLQLRKNPLWIEADQVQIEVVDQPIIKDDPQTALAMYENDEIDSMFAPSTEIDRLQADDLLSQELVFFPELCTYYYGFVHTKPPFDDVRVRRAFSAAIDRQFLVDKVTMGGEIPATTFAPPGVFGAPIPGTMGQGYDPDLARSSLQEFLDDRGLTLAEFNTAYNIVLGYPTYTAHAEIAAAIQTMWQDVLGVEVITNTLERDAYQPLIDKNVPVEDVFHIYRKSWCADYPDENNWVHEVFNAEAGYNQVRRNCADPNCETITGPTEFDQLTSTAAQTTDPIKRAQLYAQAEQILAVDEAAYAPIYHYVNTSLTQPWLTRNYPADGSLDFDNWTIDVEAQNMGRR